MIGKLYSYYSSKHICVTFTTLIYIHARHTIILLIILTPSHFKISKFNILNIYKHCLKLKIKFGIYIKIT